jgi:O-antigen biosynthesis protein
LHCNHQVFTSKNREGNLKAMLAKSNDTTNFSSIEWLTTEAVTKHKEGKSEEAIAFYLEVIEIDENQPAWVYSNVITLLTKNGFVNRAKELGKKALKNHQASDDIYRAMGIVYRSDNDQVTSAHNYQEALRLNEQQPGWVYVHLAEYFAHLGQVDKVIEFAQAGIKVDPSSGWLYYQLGDAFYAQEKWKQAAESYLQAKELEASLLEVKVKLKDARDKQEQSEKETVFHSCLLSIAKEPLKIENYIQALEIQPANIELQLKLASILIELGREDQAIECYQKAFTFNPELIQVYYAKGEKINKQLQLKELNSKSTDTADFDSNLISAFHNFKEHLVKQKKWSKIITLYNNCLKTKPNEPELYLGLSNVFVKQNRWNKAIACCKIALQLNPSYIEAEISLKQLKQKRDRVHRRFFHRSTVSAEYDLLLTQNSPQPAELDWIPEIIENFGYKPKISVIVPIYNPPATLLKEMIESVIDQIYPYWELCLADDASPDPSVKEILNQYSEQDSRIKVIFRGENGHISATSNSALTMATGDFIALLDHDDIITPDALYEVALLLNRHPEADMIYSDEDFLNENNHLESPFFKPDWCPDSFLSKMYTCHLGVYRHSIIKQIGGFRLGYEGSQDYDLVLRFTEKTNKIFHIPKVLYHWRIHAESTAGNADAKPYAYEAGVKAISDALERRGEKGKVVTDDNRPGFYTVRYEIVDYKLVSIIIPTRNYGDVLDQCLKSIFDKTTYPNFEVIVIDNGSDQSETLKVIADWQEREPKRFKCFELNIPFNFSKINNYAVNQAKGDYILFLNNDTEVLTADWLEGMVEQVQRDSIGAVGAKLLYPDDTIQHAGVLLGIGDIAGHSHKAFPRDHVGYVGQLATVNNYAAVTGACLMCRKDLFKKLGEFDEELVVAYNDVDLCLRMLKHGYNNIYLPHVVLYHHESKSRGYEDTPEKALRHQGEVQKMKAKWGDLLINDPCYNPNLSNKREDYSFRIATHLKIQDIPLPVQNNQFLLAYSVDAPRPGEQTDIGKLHIKGWVIGKDSPAKKVEIVGNGKVMSEIVVNFSRPDVAAVYQVDNAETSGFETNVWLSTMPDELYLTIQVYLDDNTRIILREFLVTINNKHNLC